MAQQIADLESKISAYTLLIDEALAEGDDESAEALLEAVERCCETLDTLRG